MKKKKDKKEKHKDKGEKVKEKKEKPEKREKLEKLKEKKEKKEKKKEKDQNKKNMVFILVNNNDGKRAIVDLLYVYYVTERRKESRSCSKNYVKIRYSFS